MLFLSECGGVGWWSGSLRRNGERSWKFSMRLDERTYSCLPSLHHLYCEKCLATISLKRSGLKLLSMCG